MKRRKYAADFTSNEKCDGEMIVRRMSKDADYVYASSDMHIAVANDEIYIDFGDGIYQKFETFDEAECAIVAWGSSGLTATDFFLTGDSFGGNLPENWEDVLDKINNEILEMPCFDKDGYLRPTTDEETVRYHIDELWEKYCAGKE